MVIHKLQQYGIWTSYAYGGAFGGKGKLEALKIVSGQWWCDWSITDRF